MDNLTSIRDALAYYHNFFQVALDRIEERIIPDMPAGWLFEELSCAEPEWFFCMRRFNEQSYLQGKGPTPRAAILAAMAKMEWIA